MKHFLLSMTFSVFGLMLLAQPVITQNPTNISVCVDSCNSLSVTAVGNNLSYHWQVDSMGVWITSATSSSNMFNVCLDTNGYDSVMWRVVVEDAQGLKDTSNSVFVFLDSCLAPIADFEFAIHSGDSVCFMNKSKYASTVIWNFGNGAQSSDFDPCLDYNDLQVWIVRLYVFNDYGSDEIEKNVDMLSIEEMNTDFSLYPNPSKGILNISSSSIVENIQVFGLKGNMVLNSQPNSMIFSLDLDQLENGVYLLQMEVDGKLVHHKVILND